MTQRQASALPRRRVALSALAHVLLTGALTLVPTAFAQASLFGAGAAFVDLLPLPSVQVGGDVAPNVRLRLTLDALPPMFFNVGADVLYVAPASGAGRTWYVGGGPGVVVVTLPIAAGVVTVHATGGVELPIGEHTGFYVELEPGVDLGFRAPVIGLRTGVDWHF